MNYRTKKKIKENEKLMHKIDFVMAVPKIVLGTSGGLLAVGAMTGDQHIIIGSMVGAVIGIGTAIHTDYLYNVNKVVVSPHGADDWSYVERKALKEQYEDAQEEIDRLKRQK